MPNSAPKLQRNRLLNDPNLKDKYKNSVKEDRRCKMELETQSGTHSKKL